MSWLEVLSTPPQTVQPRVGDRIPLAGMVVRVPQERPRGIFQKRGEHWSAVDAGLGIGVNGKRAETARLNHGDVVELSAGFSLRFCAREEVRLREPKLEAAIAEAPDDEGRWRVYADWLQERGDSLGEFIATGGDRDDLARRLGPLARIWRRGNLELTLRHGFIRSARLRALDTEPTPDSIWCLHRLFELEVGRFVQELNVDLFTSHLEGEQSEVQQRVAAVLEALKQAPRTMREVTLGPVPMPLTSTLCPVRGEGEFPHVRVAHFTRVLLSDGVREIELTADQQVLLFHGEPLALSLSSDGSAWAERPEPRLAPSFKINGHHLWHARLMPGDVVQPAHGVKLKVEVA